MQTEILETGNLRSAIVIVCQLCLIAIVIAILLAILFSVGLLIGWYLINLLDNPCNFDMGSSRCT